MCQGIARAGNGMCLMATSSDMILAKCSKLVKASRTPMFRDINVNWNCHTQTIDSRPCDGQVDLLRQAPQNLPSPFHGVRYTVHALIDEGNVKIPQDVVFEATPVGSTETLTVVAPVEELPKVKRQRGRPILHTFAARRLIMDLEDREEASQLSAQTRDTIVRLGNTINLQVNSPLSSPLRVLDRSSCIRPRPWSQPPAPGL